MQVHSRRTMLAGFAALAVSSPSAVAREQPLKIVFPFSPGGSGDAIARLFAEHLQTRLGRAVIVDNRAGAGGRIGAQAVKNATPDEETLLFASASQFSLQPHLFLNLGYDPFVDFVPVSQAVTIDLALAVNSQLPVRSVGELIAWIKANPDRAIYGSPGAGTAPHFICTEFGRVTGLNLRHVAYRGTPAALPDVLAGRYRCIWRSFPNCWSKTGPAASESWLLRPASGRHSYPRSQRSRRAVSTSTRQVGLRSMLPPARPVKSLNA